MPRNLAMRSLKIEDARLLFLQGFPCELQHAADFLEIDVGLNGEGLHRHGGKRGAALSFHVVVYDLQQRAKRRSAGLPL